jgi:hypothetical protein
MARWSSLDGPPVKEPAVPHAVIDPALDELMQVIGECEHLVLHFHGPVCGMPAWSDSDVTSQLRGLLAGHGIQLPYPAGATISPYDILRFILTACPQLAGSAEAEVAAHEVRAAAVARPAVGIRSLLRARRRSPSSAMYARPRSAPTLGACTRASATGSGWSSRGMVPTRPSWSPLLSQSCRPLSSWGCRPRRVPWWPAPRLTSTAPAWPAPAPSAMPATRPSASA